MFPVTLPPKVTPPDPEASSVAPLPVRVIARVVESPVPVYCKIPAAAIEMAGVVAPVPIELLLEALANLLTLSVPAVRMFAFVYELPALVNVWVGDPVPVKLSVNPKLPVNVPA